MREDGRASITRRALLIAGRDMLRQHPAATVVRCRTSAEHREPAQGHTTSANG